MKSNELRIGNLVECKNPNKGTYRGAVDQILNDGIIVDQYIFFRWDEIHPIPLTPEILEACGFEKTKRSDQFKFQDIILSTWEENEFVMLRTDGYDVYPRMPLIKHLYQLQNLYFALIGEELKVNIENKISV